MRHTPSSRPTPFSGTGRPCLILTATTVTFTLLGLWRWVPALTGAPLLSDAEYDAIIVPGGGQTEAGHSQPFVEARLDAAIAAQLAATPAHDPSQRPPIVVLSAGTVHKPNPRDGDGFPVYEADSEARYLMSRGVAAEDIYQEKLSLDTIGNAFYARVIHAEVAGWRRLLVITSEFHMPRTQAIFQWVFTLPAMDGSGDEAYELEFRTTENRGMADDVVGE